MKHTFNGTIVITNCMSGKALSEFNQETQAVSNLSGVFCRLFAKADAFACAANLFLARHFPFMPHLSGKNITLYFL